MNGTLEMSLKERDRVMVFRLVEQKQLSLGEAAVRLGLCYRQVRRLRQQYRKRGDAGLVHGLRGRPSNNHQEADARRERAVVLYREHYRGLGPTLASEEMAARNDLVVDHETLRGWLTAAGLWKPSRQRRRRHPRRPRRACLGELVQFDGSDHDWFGTGVKACLMVMIDDATGLTHARFFEVETTHAAMTVFRDWARRYGLPRALYPDRHGIHRRNDKAADEIEHRTGVRPLTRFGEAMRDLGVELICAHSPQAKGRVERANGTHQDRLVKLLRLEGITTIEAANAYLEEVYLPRHNGRFPVKPAEAADAHRPAPPVEELDAVLCPVREVRCVDLSGCVSWQGRCFELLGADATPRRRKKVQVRQRLDGRVQLLDAAGRLLESCERPAPPPRLKPERVPLAQRLAGQAGPAKPAADHPWRLAPAVAGSGPARCARLPSASHRGSSKRTVLLG